MSNQWISVKDKLPDVEPNTISYFCQVLCEDGSIYHAIFVHDVETLGSIEVDTKYFSGIETVAYKHGCYGYENEYYQITGVTHYAPMPEMPPKGLPPKELP